jgi:hypothetical protein
MRPVLIALLAISLAILPACGGLEVRPAPPLREVVFTLPDTAHNKLATRMAEFARDHKLGFHAADELAHGELKIQMWRGFVLLSDFMLFISKSRYKREIASVTIIDGLYRRAALDKVEPLSLSLEKALVEVPGVTIISAKTCPCPNEP